MLEGGMFWGTYDIPTVFFKTSHRQLKKSCYPVKEWFHSTGEEGVHIVKTSLCLLLSNNVVDRPRARGPKQLTNAHYDFTDNGDDELTIRKFHHVWLGIKHQAEQDTAKLYELDEGK